MEFVPTRGSAGAPGRLYPRRGSRPRVRRGSWTGVDGAAVTADTVAETTGWRALEAGCAGAMNTSGGAARATATGIEREVGGGPEAPRRSAKVVSATITTDAATAPTTRRETRFGDGEVPGEPGPPGAASRRALDHGTDVLSGSANRSRGGGAGTDTWGFEAAEAGGGGALARRNAAEAGRSTAKVLSQEARTRSSANGKSARPRAHTDSKRAPGSRLIARTITASNAGDSEGTTSRGGANRPDAMAFITTKTVSPTKGFRCVAHS